MMVPFKMKKKISGRVGLGKGELKNCVLIICLKSLLDVQGEIPSTQLDIFSGCVEPNTTGSRHPMSQWWFNICHVLAAFAP